MLRCIQINFTFAMNMGLIPKSFSLILASKHEQPRVQFVCTNEKNSYSAQKFSSFLSKDVTLAGPVCWQLGTYPLCHHRSQGWLIVVLANQ